MMLDRRLILHFDWTLVGLALLLSLLGILNLYSHTSNGEAAGIPLHVKQILWLLFGLAIMLIVAFIDYRFFSDLSMIAYVLACFALLLVLAVGTATAGAQRWIKIGSLSFQPSEFAKIVLILVLGKFFNRPPLPEGYSLRDLLWPFLFLALPVLLILKQPDLGTAIILVLIFVSVLFFVKIRWSSWLILVGAGLSILPLLWSILKDYQKRRIITFFDPDLDPLGAGYHIIQSKIAVGSGGLLGKGFMEGTQSKLGFLPEQRTDFIFSALAEEWGLVGSLVVAVGYFALLWWGLWVAVHAKDRLGAILAFGVVAMLFWHTLINLGMVLGMMPVVGIPLPFFSYGGSFMLSTYLGIGLLLNVSMRRHLF